MTRLRISLASLALLFSASVGLPGPAVADQMVRGSLRALQSPAPGSRIQIAVKTREGLEQFELRLDEEFGRTASLVHLRGESRPRRGRGSHTPVAASRVDGRYHVFFTSSRWGVPSVASFSLVPTEAGLRPANVQVRRSGRRSLPCGSGRPQRLARVKSGGTRAGAGILGDGDSSPFNPPRILEIATRADYDFYLLYGASTNDYIAATVHAAEVLYAAPLGLKLRLASQGVQTAGWPNTAPVDAALLLEGFRQQAIGESTNYDVFHLFTGRPLAGRTIGIAYVTSACSGRGRFNIGLSRTISQPLQPLLFAHEVAHNLGSYHDAVPNSVMNPVLSANNNMFSQGSLAAMKSAINSRMRCIAKLPDHDLSVSLAGTNSQVFSATISSNSTRAELCSVNLFAQALRSGRGYGPTYRVASRQVLLSPGLNPNQVTFTGSMPPGPVQPAEIAFFSKTWCKSRSYISPSQQLQVSAEGNGASSSAPADGRQWMLLLRSALAN